ncbi:unnamed protein product [Arctogadus glacialis]
MQSLDVGRERQEPRVTGPLAGRAVHSASSTTDEAAIFNKNRELLHTTCIVVYHVMSRPEGKAVLGDLNLGAPGLGAEQRVVRLRVCVALVGSRRGEDAKVDNKRWSWPGLCCSDMLEAGDGYEDTAATSAQGVIPPPALEFILTSHG